MYLKNIKEEIKNIKKIKIKYFLLFLVIFLPKIDLFQLPINGVKQGPRIEDIILLFFVLSFFIPSKKPLLIWSDKFIFKNWIIFFCILMFFNIIHVINGKSLNLLIFLRIFEYVILIIFLNNLLNKGNIFKIIKAFIIINFIVALLQSFNLIGSFSSIGYLPPDHLLNQRAYGILGGSWELGIVFGILSLACFRARNQFKNYIFYMTICSVIIFLAYGITNLLAYLTSIIFILWFSFYERIKKFNFKFIAFAIMIPFIILVTIFLSDLNLIIVSKLENNSFILRMSKIDFVYLYEVYREYFRTGYIPGLEVVQDPQTHYSIILRLKTWQNSIAEFQTSNLAKFIGIGLNELYLESLIIRTITAVGIIGCMFVFFSIINVPMYFLIFIFICGINIDLFISIKIFIFTFMFFKINQLMKNGNNFI